MAAVGVGAFVGPIPVNFILFAIAVPVVWFYLEHTVSGRAAFALGVNKEAVRLAGVDVKKHLIGAYVICGLFAAISGVLLASRLGIAQPSVGVGYELDAIAAVAVGGTLLTGGKANIFGTIVGAFVIQLMQYTLLANGVPDAAARVVKAALIIVAVFIQQRAHKA